MTNLTLHMFKNFVTYLFGLALLLPCYLYGQTVEEIVSKADEIIIRLTNQEYFDQLRRPSEPFKRNWLDSDDSTRKSYFVPYSLKNTENVNFYIGTDGGLTGAGMFIELDENLELLDQSFQESQAKSQLKAYHRFKSGGFMPRKDAEILANKHFSKNFKKPFDNYMLIYDSKADSLFWRFYKFKGFRNYTVDSVYINAETGIFDRKESMHLRRNFWQALFLHRLL